MTIEESEAMSKSATKRRVHENFSLSTKSGGKSQKKCLVFYNLAAAYGSDLEPERI